MSGTNDSTNGNTCVVCYKHVEIYSIGMCEHPVCYECSTRMRVLCQQNECPICRQELPKVVFTREIKPFRHLRKGRHYDSQYAIFFDDADIHVKFGDLLAHACSQCGQQFDDFSGLKDHMRRKHELHYCDLCVANIKVCIFRLSTSTCHLILYMTSNTNDFQLLSDIFKRAALLHEGWFGPAPKKRRRGRQKSQGPSSVRVLRPTLHGQRRAVQALAQGSFVLPLLRRRRIASILQQLRLPQRSLSR